MTRMRMKTTLMVSLLVLLCIATSRAQKQPDSNDADSTAIKHTIGDWSGAFDRHDAHECALRFVDDADFVSVSGLTFHGRKAIEDHYVSSFSSTLKDAHRTDTVKSIRFLSPDIASVDVDWEMTGARTADGSERPPRKGLLEPVLVKQNGQWSIAVFHETEFNVSSGR
jgi:uncharacterized protein (TIGR02246 family)